MVHCGEQRFASVIFHIPKSGREIAGFWVCGFSIDGREVKEDFYVEAVETSGDEFREGRRAAEEEEDGLIAEAADIGEVVRARGEGRVCLLDFM